jgi:hypothetical protein
MKTLIIFYSFTGNNATLAKAIARKLDADCIELKEIQKRTVFTIVLDVFFNRTPKIQNIENQFDQYEYLIFVAPVWFGKIRTPLRAVFQHMKGKNKKLSFVSISAGADGINPGLESEITKRTGSAPKIVINQLIRDLLPADSKPNRKLVDEYKISEEEAEMMANNVFNQLNAERQINPTIL